MIKYAALPPRCRRLKVFGKGGISRVNNTFEKNRKGMSCSETAAETGHAAPLILDERNLGRNIVRLALPAVLENVSHSVLILVDLMMVGWLGSIPALSAVGFSGGVWFMNMILFIPLAIGVTALVARNIGARNFEEARRVAGQGILLALIIGVAASGLIVLLSPRILDAMNITGETKELALPYQRLIFGVFVFDLLFMIASGAIRGAGNTRTPMIVAAFANGLNLVLDWFLIFGHGPFPKLGVLGAGIATSISIVCGGALMTGALFTRYSVFRLRLRNLRRFSWRILRDIFGVSLPNIFEQLILDVGFVAFWWILTRLGDVTIAAHSIAVRIESFSFLPGMGFAVAASTLAGQSIGAGDVRLAEKSMRRTAFLAALLMSMMGVLLALFPEFFAGLFGAAPPVRNLAAACLIVGAMEQIPLALFMSYAGGLRGTGDTLSAMMVTIVGMVFVRVPLARVFAIEAGWGVVGMWVACVLDWIVRAFLAHILIKHGRWRKHAVKPVMVPLPVLEVARTDLQMPDEI